MDLSDTVRLLGDLLGQVVSVEESPQLFDTEERIRALAKARRAGDALAGAQLATEVATLLPNAARVVASAFTVYFDLVNVAEEDYRVQALRQRQRDQYPQPINDSIAAALEQLQQRGVTDEQLTAVLNQLHIELVLTAHPTEAKRRTILSKLQRVAQGLRQLDATDLLPREHAEVLKSLRAEITALWLTDQARTARPGVTDEVRTGLYFIDEIFLPHPELLEALAARQVKIGIQTRIDLWNHPTLDLLGRAGCVSLEAGVESISSQGRALLDKQCRLSTDELAERLIYAKKAIPFVQANLLDAKVDDPRAIEAWRRHLQPYGG
jgi:phosphoenolpyruvate carboxylase